MLALDGELHVALTCKSPWICLLSCFFSVGFLLPASLVSLLLSNQKIGGEI
jgi:hypothetical protein